MFGFYKDATFQVSVSSNFLVCCKPDILYIAWYFQLTSPWSSKQFVSLEIIAALKTILT